MNYLKLVEQLSRPVKPLANKAYNSMITDSKLRKLVPVSDITIETTNICNLRCPGCYRTTHEYASKNKNMSLEDFTLYVDQLPNALALILHGYGEPTVNPQIGEMIEYAHNTGKFNRISFVSNALARKPEIYDKLFAKGLTDIMISVDSLDQEEVEHMRPGTNCKKLEENLKILFKKHADKIEISMVISKININTFQKTVKRLVKVGMKSITLQSFEDLGDPTNCLTYEQKQKYLKTADKFDFEGVKITTSRNFGIEHKPCYSPFFSPVITVDGYLSPCCRHIDKDFVNFGNLKEKPFKELFFSDTINKMQEDMVNGEYPWFCKKCPLNHSETKQLKTGLIQINTSARTGL